MPEVCPIVLAAGKSSRFGTESKLAALHQGRPLVGWAVDALQQAGLPVTVVVGHEADKVRAACPPGVTFVENPNYETGMGSSIAAGVRSLPETAAILVVLGDMPGLQAGVVRKLLAAYNSANRPLICAPVYSLEGGRIGQPVLFGPEYRGELIALRGDQGARCIIDRHQRAVVAVPVEGRLDDVDLPAGLG